MLVVPAPEVDSLPVILEVLLKAKSKSIDHRKRSSVEHDTACGPIQPIPNIQRVLQVRLLLGLYNYGSVDVHCAISAFLHHDTYLPQ